MPQYISEFRYYGDTSQEFIEVALPAGTDPTGYTVQIYMDGGSVFGSFSLGTSTGTMGGHDVYVIDASTPGYSDGGADPTGNLYPDDALALVDGGGTVQQFISYWGNTVTATSGPAAGLTSTDVGTANTNDSLQSDDGGSTYYTQSLTNPGTIPACYAFGSLIATPTGPRAIQEIAAGDLISKPGGNSSPVLWIWKHTQLFTSEPSDKKPVLIQAGAIGINRPGRDLIVSAQHRIVVGAYGQLEAFFDQPMMVPAKSLTQWPGIRFMNGKSEMTWYHLLCRDHNIIFANNLASETLLLGPECLRTLSRTQKTELRDILGRPFMVQQEISAALPSLKVRETRSLLSSAVVAHRSKRKQRARTSQSRSAARGRSVS